MPAFFGGTKAITRAWGPARRQDWPPHVFAALIDATVSGKRVPAVVEFSKSGLLYVLDRLTGKPIWGVEERPVPPSDVPGEQAWPTQPFPVKPPLLTRLSMTKDEVSNISPEAHAYCLEQFEKLKTLGPFTPFSVNEPRLAFPSSMGGADWAGVSYDPKLGYIFANASNLGQTGQMVPTAPGSPIPAISRLGENYPQWTRTPATWFGEFPWDRTTSWKPRE